LKQSPLVVKSTFPDGTVATARAGGIVGNPISHNGQIAKFEGRFAHPEPSNMTETRPNFVSQNGKAKSEIVTPALALVSVTTITCF